MELLRGGSTPTPARALLLVVTLWHTVSRREWVLRLGFIKFGYFYWAWPPRLWAAGLNVKRRLGAERRAFTAEEAAEIVATAKGKDGDLPPSLASERDAWTQRLLPNLGQMSWLQVEAALKLNNKAPVYARSAISPGVHLNKTADGRARDCRPRQSPQAAPGLVSDVAGECPEAMWPYVEKLGEEEAKQRRLKRACTDIEILGFDTMTGRAFNVRYSGGSYAHADHVVPAERAVAFLRANPRNRLLLSPEGSVIWKLLDSRVIVLPHGTITSLDTSGLEHYTRLLVDTAQTFHTNDAVAFVVFAQRAQDGAYEASVYMGDVSSSPQFRVELARLMDRFQRKVTKNFTLITADTTGVRRQVADHARAEAARLVQVVADMRARGNATLLLVLVHDWGSASTLFAALHAACGTRAFFHGLQSNYRVAVGYGNSRSAEGYKRCIRATGERRAAAAAWAATL
ncbi:hypothetical protein WJX81_001742 [Elliptochloris bilobata]|uniref:Uncharacterized protein n=1 Tax=Elliptochloris bilobata TaxID=381761 RepID=A0AAW1RQV6_9CHLO